MRSTGIRPGIRPGTRNGIRAGAVRETSGPGPQVVQPSFDDLGTPLWQVTFVVLDLETTGLSPGRDAITEVGAVKVRGGDRIGEFHALVRPSVPIPPAVASLTGITEAMVAKCPPIEAVVPALAEFLRGTVIVAHNAAFDVSFLQAAFAGLAYPPLDNPVVDTARLARRVLPRDEVRDVRLSTLAHHLRATVKPEHRALADARATVDVLHALLERAGGRVRTLEDLRDYTRSRSDPTFRKIGLVDGAPDAPGVYRFLDERGEVLYVGKAVRLRERLRQYFGTDPRRKVADLVRDTAKVVWEVAPTELEAQVREVRAIHRHRPRYNRRSRHPEKAVYVKLTRERFPRLSVVTAPRDAEALHVGPLPSRRVAEQFLEAVHDVIPLRRCTVRLTARGDQPACALKDIGRCGAPCDGTQDEASYAAVVDTYARAVRDDPAPLLEALRTRMLAHATDGRFEQASRDRARLHRAAQVLGQARRLAALVAVEELVAACADGDEVEVALVLRGRLAGTARVAADEVEAAVASLRAAAPPAPAPGPPPREDVEEVQLVAAWLARPGVRVVEARGEFAERVAGGAVLAATLAEAKRVSRAVARDRQLASGAKVLRRVG